MGTFQAKDDTGYTHSFKIAGDQPSEAEMIKFQTVMSRLNGTDKSTEPAGFGQSVSAGIQGLQSSAYGGLETFGKAFGSDWLEQTGKEGVIRNDAEQQAILPDEQRADPGFNTAYAKQAVGETTPYMGLGLAGGFAGQAAGAAIGSALFPGVGTVLGGLAGRGLGSLIGTGVGATAAYFLPQVGSAASRQRDAYGSITDPGAAIGAGLLTYMTESVMDVFLLKGGGKLLSAAATKGYAIPEKVAKSKVANILADASIGGGIEAAQEVSQAMIERISAGLPLDDEEAMYEYKVAGLTAAGIGAGMGGGAGVIKHGLSGRKDKQTAKQKQQMEEDQLLRAEPFRPKFEGSKLIAQGPFPVRALDDKPLGDHEIIDNSRNKTAPKKSISIIGIKGSPIGDYSWQYDDNLVKGDPELGTDDRTEMREINPDARFKTKQEAIVAASEDLITVRREDREQQEALAEFRKTGITPKKPREYQYAFDATPAKKRDIRALKNALKRDKKDFTNPATQEAFTSDEIEALDADTALDLLSKREMAQAQAEKDAIQLSDADTQTIVSHGPEGIPESDLRKFAGEKTSRPDQMSYIADLIDAGIITPVQSPETSQGQSRRYKLSHVEKTSPNSYRPLYLVEKDAKGNVVVTAPTVNPDIPQDGSQLTDNVGVQAKAGIPVDENGNPIPAQTETAQKTTNTPVMSGFADEAEAHAWIRKQLRQETKADREQEAKVREKQREEARYETPEDKGERQGKLGISKARAYLLKILKQYGLEDIALELETAYDGLERSGNVEGLAYQGRLIKLYWDIYQKGTTQEELKTKLADVMNHEVIHILSMNRLWKDNELKDLRNYVMKKKRVIDGKLRDYTYFQWAEKLNSNPDGSYLEGMTKESIMEEAIAEMFRDWSKKPGIVTGRPASLLNKIIKLFKAFFKLSDDDKLHEIFRRVAKGEVGSRRNADGVIKRENADQQAFYNSINDNLVAEKALKDEKAAFDEFKSTTLTAENRGAFGDKKFEYAPGQFANQQIFDRIKQYETDIKSLEANVEKTKKLRDAENQKQIVYAKSAFANPSLVGKRIEASSGSGDALRYPTYEQYATEYMQIIPEQADTMPSKEEFFKLRNEQIDQFVEKPAQPLIREVYKLGGQPYASNAYGPGEKGVWYKDQDGKEQFMPLDMSTDTRFSSTPDISKAAIRIKEPDGSRTIIESFGPGIGSHGFATIALEDSRDDLKGPTGEIDFDALDIEEGFTLTEGSWATRQEAYAMARQLDQKLADQMANEIGFRGETVEESELTAEGFELFQDRMRAANELRDRVAKAAASGEDALRTLLHSSHVKSKAGNADDIDPDLLEKIKQDDIASQMEMKNARDQANQAITENDEAIIRFSSAPGASTADSPARLREISGLENQASQKEEDQEAAHRVNPTDSQREDARHASTINGLMDWLEGWIRGVAYNFTEEQKAADLALRLTDKDSWMHRMLTLAQVKLQDQYAPVGQFMYNVIKAGGIVVEGNDPRRLLTLFRSKAGEDIEARKDKGGLYYITATLLGGLKNNISDIDALLNIKAVKEFVDANKPGEDGPARAAYTILGNLKQKKGTSGMSAGQVITELFAVAKAAPARNAMVAGRYIWTVNGYPYLDEGEANAYGQKEGVTPIKTNNPETLARKGSGLTDQEAAVIVAHIERIQNFNKINEAYEAMRNIVRDTNRVRKAQGLVPMSFDDGMESFYMPLRGKADPYFSNLDPDGEKKLNAYVPRVGQGASVKGKEDKAVLGRQSMPMDIFYNLMVQNSESIVRGAKNEVGMSFARMLRQNYRLFGKLTTVTDGFGKEHTIVVNDPEGPVHNSPAYEIDPRSNEHFTDKVVQVKENGKTVKRVKRVANNKWKDEEGFNGFLYEFKENGEARLIWFKDDSVARALTKSAGEESHNWFFKASATLNHYLSMANITYNPEFLLPNWIRDTMTAAINVNQYELEGISKDVLSNIKLTAKAFRQLYRELPHTPDTEEIHKYIKEMRDFGGITSFAGLRDLETVMKDALSWNAQNLGSPDAEIAGNLAQKGVYKFTQMMEHYQSVAENTTRGAVYIALRQRGFTAQKAADASKRMTVDFNAGGEWKPAINSLYLFYNASVQGSAAILGGFARSPKVRKIVLGIAATGMMTDFMNSMMSPLDDDGEPIYDKIPQYVLEHNIILLDFLGITERGYFAIPMPYGYNAVWNVGRHTSKSMMGRESAGEAMIGMASGLANAYNPFGGSNSLLNFMLPTAVDPMVELYLNKDFANRPIHKEESQFGADVPDSQQYWNSTTGLAKGIANILRDPLGWTGLKDPLGNEIPGMIEIHPDSIEYGYDALTGGLGKFVRRTYDLGARAFTKDGFEDFSFNSVPLGRRFYGNITTRNDLTSYVEKRNWALTLLKEEKTAMDNGEFQRLKYHRAKYKDELKIARRVKVFNSQRVALARQIRKITNNTRIPQADRDKRLKQLRDRQDEVVLKANTFMNKEGFEAPGLMNLI